MIQKQYFKEQKKYLRKEKNNKSLDNNKEKKEEDPELIKPNFQDKIVYELNNIKNYINENILNFPGIEPKVQPIIQ